MDSLRQIPRPWWSLRAGICRAHGQSKHECYTRSMQRVVCAHCTLLQPHPPLQCPHGLAHTSSTHPALWSRLQQKYWKELPDQKKPSRKKYAEWPYICFCLITHALYWLSWHCYFFSTLFSSGKCLVSMINNMIFTGIRDVYKDIFMGMQY